MPKEKLSQCETARKFDIYDHHNVADFRQIYLEEGKKVFCETSL